VPLHVVKVSYSAHCFLLGHNLVNPASTVRDLGIYINADFLDHTGTENIGVVFCCSATAADSTSVPAIGRLQITDRVTGA